MTEVIFKRKYRWAFSAEFPEVKIENYFCKIKERPSMDITEKENADGSWKIERYVWLPLVTTFYSVGVNDNKELFELLAKFYQFGAVLFQEENPVEKLDEIKEHLGVGRLVMYDGCGMALEEWVLREMWPHSVNFGELCFDSSSDIDIEVTWRYKECQYKQLNTA